MSSVFLIYDVFSTGHHNTWDLSYGIVCTALDQTRTLEVEIIGHEKTCKHQRERFEAYDGALLSPQDGENSHISRFESTNNLRFEVRWGAVRVVTMLIRTSIFPPHLWRRPASGCTKFMWRIQSRVSIVRIRWYHTHFHRNVWQRRNRLISVLHFWPYFATIVYSPTDRIARDSHPGKYSCYQKHITVWKIWCCSCWKKLSYHLVQIGSDGLS
jgi:hypothetical protein